MVLRLVCVMFCFASLGSFVGSVQLCSPGVSTLLLPHVCVYVFSLPLFFLTLLSYVSSRCVLCVSSIVHGFPCEVLLPFILMYFDLLDIV